MTSADALSYDAETLRQAHRHAQRNADEVKSSLRCGCFYCLEVFLSDEIGDWISDEGTALCPGCGVDSVIGELSGYPVADAAFLKAMHDKCFED